MKHTNTKRALIASLLSVVLCLAMLVGSTFAWFTDTETVAVGNIVAGTLDIQILDAEGKEKKDALKFLNADNSANILWEPGATFRTEGFQLKNVGDLWLKCKLEINNTEVSYNKLNEVISFKLVNKDGEEVSINGIAIAPNTTYDTMLYIEGTMKAGAGNAYQGLTLEGVSVTVYATQYTSEKDMNGATYDKDATYDDEVTPVATADEFIKAFTDLEENGIIALTADIDLTGKTWTPVANKGFTLDGGDYKITGMNGALVSITGTKNYTVKNVTFENLTINEDYAANAAINFGGAAGLIAYADTCTYINMEDVTINNAAISGAEFIGGFAGYTSGYGNDSDGPVNASHNFTNCTITNSKLTSSTDGSVGGLIGHAGSNPATTTRIGGFKYENLTLSQNEARTDKLGYMIGTANVGIVYIADDIAVENSAEIGYIGRFVPNGTGKLVINEKEIDAFDGEGN